MARRAPGSHTAPRPGTSLARSSFAGLELPWINTSYGNANPINPVGRLYFTGYSRQLNKWYDSFCTGTLVAPNIVITAAHCIREGRPDGVTCQNFTFAPPVNGSSRPFGTFTSVLSHMGKVYRQNGANPCPYGSPRYGKTFFGSYLDNDVQTLFNFAKTL